MHYTRSEYFILTLHNQECLLMMLQRQQSLSADAVWDCPRRERRNVRFCRTGTITLWIHSEPLETLQRESRVAGQHFPTRMANINLTALRQTSLFVLGLLGFFFSSSYLPLVVPTCLSHLVHDADEALYLKYRMRSQEKATVRLDSLSLFSAAITAAASLVRRRETGRCEVKGTQARLSGQGAERWKRGWLMDKSESSAALGSCWDVSSKLTPSTCCSPLLAHLHFSPFNFCRNKRHGLLFSNV